MKGLKGSGSSRRTCRILKRTGNSMKSSRCERKDGVDDNFMEGEEENG